MEVSSISNVKDDGSNDIESVIETGSLDCSAPPQVQRRKAARSATVLHGLFVFSAITGTLYAGAFFSWGPMQLLLEAHGVFEDRCKEGEATPCPAQTTRLLTVQFVAQFAIVLSPILGGIADHYGVCLLSKPFSIHLKVSPILGTSKIFGRVVTRFKVGHDWQFEWKIGLVHRKGSIASYSVLASVFTGSKSTEK